MKGFRNRALDANATTEDILAAAGEFFDSPAEYLDAQKPKPPQGMPGVPPEVDASIPDYAQAQPAPEAPPPAPRMAPAVPKAPMAPQGPRRSLESEMQAGRAEDALRNGFDRTSAALYSAFSRTPLRMPERTSDGERNAMASFQASERDAMADPSSPESVRARELLSGTALGAALQKRLGPGFEQLPASQLPGIERLLAMEGRATKVDPTAEARSKYLEQLTEESKARVGGMGKGGKSYVSLALAEMLGDPRLEGLSESQAGLVLKKMQEDAKSSRAAKAITQRAAELAGKAKQERADASTDIAGTRYVLEDGRKPNKATAGKVAETASAYSGALAGIDDFGAQLEEYVRAPSVEKRAELLAKVGAVGGAINSANGQGAMSDSEYRQRVSDMGASNGSADAIAAWMTSILEGDDDKAVKLMSARLRGLRQTMSTMAGAKMRSYGLVPEGGGKTGDAGKVKRGADGKDYIVYPDGSAEPVDEEML